jgi:tetratricopeptide (TPR) repeat protein
MSLPRVRFLLVLSPLLSACLVFGQTTEEKQEAQRLHKEATALEAKKDFEGAVTAIGKALELAPKSDVYLAYASKVEFLAGMTKEALAHGIEATKLKPGNANYLAVVMRGTLSAKDLDNAKTYADKIIILGAKVDPKLLAEARGVVAKVEFPNTDPILVAARYATPEKIKTLTNSVRASSKAEPKNLLHKDRLVVLEPLATVAELDLRVLATPKAAEGSLDDLSAHLGKLAKTDWERARVVYRWITDRIALDMDAVATGSLGEKAPEEVLKQRKCRCQGYANLFEALANRLGLEAVYISGFAKGQNFDATKTLQNHGWNGVKIDGQWRIVDCTWGAGVESAKKGFQKYFREFYFLADPQKLAFTHFPREEKWQLVDPIATREDFESTPRASFEVFDLQNDFRKIKEATQEKTFRSFVLIYSPPAIPFRMIDGPLSKHLASGRPYRFVFEAPEECAAMSIDLNGESVPLTRKRFTFEGTIRPRRGPTELRASLKSSPQVMFGLLKYDAE